MFALLFQLFRNWRDHTQDVLKEISWIFFLLWLTQKLGVLLSQFVQNWSQLGKVLLTRFYQIECGLKDFFARVMIACAWENRFEVSAPISIHQLLENVQSLMREKRWLNPNLFRKKGANNNVYSLYWSTLLSLALGSPGDLSTSLFSWIKSFNKVTALSLTLRDVDDSTSLSKSSAPPNRTNSFWANGKFLSNVDKQNNSLELYSWLFKGNSAVDCNCLDKLPRINSSNWDLNAWTCAFGLLKSVWFNMRLRDR